MLEGLRGKPESSQFKGEMAKEWAGFEETLSNLGEEAFEAGTSILLDAPFSVFQNKIGAFRGGGGFWGNMASGIGGIIAVAYQAIKLSTKTTKILVKELFLAHGKAKKGRKKFSK